mgnify:FL=1
MVRILIADDEMIEREVLCKTLRKNLKDKCIIFQAENGREALEAYEEYKIQIAILDIEMPGINGIEAAEEIRKNDKKCCIIFLTAFDEFAYAKKAITVRALDYLLKPYEENELMLVMEEAIRLVSEQEETYSAWPKNRETESAEEKASQEKKAKKEPEEDVKEPEALSEDEYENVRLSGVKEMIEQHIFENYRKDISMQELAHAMNYSEAYFCKLFKQCFGKNFTSYLTEYRVDAAKKLLEDPMVNIKEIGRTVGYGDSNYFTKVFRRVTGISPTEYRTRIFRENKER